MIWFENTHRLLKRETVGIVVVRPFVEKHFSYAYTRLERSLSRANKKPRQIYDEVTCSGSSGRTRTYNNSVNSRGLYH